MNWTDEFDSTLVAAIERVEQKIAPRLDCLLYTSDAADD